MSDSFDRLLAHSQRRPGAPPGPCPEAGVLAAYLDGSLGRAERMTVETHVADCARCALQLATVVRLEDESGHPQHAPQPRWWRRLAWVAPAATAATVAAIYLAVPSSVPPPLSGPAAESAAPATPAPSRVPRAVPSAPPVQPPAPLAARANGSGDSGSPARQRTRRAPASEEPTSPPLAGVAGGVPELAAKAEGVVRDAETRELQAFSAARPEADTAERAKVGEIQARVMARNSPVSVRVPEPPAVLPFTVQTPDGLVQWRIAGALVDRSVDGGHTWSSERAPAASGVTMGAAPSGSVCWLATPSGRVLRRNEDGEWHDVSPVPPVTLARLQDATARGVTLVAQDGTSITTGDEGRRWTRHAPR